VSGLIIAIPKTALFLTSWTAISVEDFYAALEQIRKIAASIVDSVVEKMQKTSVK
jgi:hypothetical protein